MSRERWAQFSFDDQVLMIGNEMNRAMRLLDSEQWEHARRCYERILQLADLTAAVATTRSRRREMLRWREPIAELFIDERPSRDAHEALFRCLLQLASSASRQIPLLFPPEGSPKPEA